MKLLRIGVANFRSIGAQPVMIDLQKRINLLIGANNSGKSNVLEIVRAVQTDEETVAAAVEVGRRMGRKVTVIKESSLIASTPTTAVGQVEMDLPVQ